MSDFAYMGSPTKPNAVELNYPSMKVIWVLDIQSVEGCEIIWSTLHF